MATYTTYPYGKLNQSFAMKDEQGNSVYEANLIKFRFFSASDFEFVNKKNSTTTPHKVGKTRSSSSGTGTFHMTTTSYFKLDGKNVFKILDEKGYSFKFNIKLDIFHPEFTLIENNTNKVVATYKTNVLGDKQAKVVALGNKQRNILVTTDLEDIETIFLGAFILSRVDFSANTF